MAQPHTYREHAAQARADAEAATLDNVRDRCLRAEAAWLEMAVRQERTDLARAAREAPKVAPAPDPAPEPAAVLERVEETVDG